MKILSLVGKILFWVVVVPIMIMAMIVMVKANKYPDKIPDVFGYKPMIVLSGSMETAIYTGDLVFVKMVDVDTLEKNDVIAFRNETNTVTTHRIVEIVEENGKTAFRTKGDNNNTADADLVKEANVEGVYVFKIAKLGSLLMILKEPQTLAVTLLTILVIGMIWLYIADRLDKKEDSKYKKEFEEFKRMKQEEQK